MLLGFLSVRGRNFSTNITTSWSTRAQELVNLERYPIEPIDSSLVVRCRDVLRETGVCLLPSFLHQAAVQTILQSCCPEKVCASAFTSHNTHNIFQQEPNSLEIAQREAPLRTRMGLSTIGSIACDELPSNGPLLALYHWNALRDFIAQVTLGPNIPLYRLADPLGACSVNVFRAGAEAGQWWHFDEAQFTTTIMLQEADEGCGGNFDLVPDVRSDGSIDSNDQSGAGFARACAALDEDHSVIRRLHEFRPGTLSIFHGSRSLHRVTPVTAGKDRLVAVLCFHTSPGVVNSDSVRKQYWGR
eukprot:gnl/Spiro4/6074_TR3115_c0_g1_i1.p1 gnl/Spiro4/6074_TR3115_c0_g1~~gnl/Spiro4/6074_TR3115_c0_g1_i1.p1  ORF type:complete len:301 (+),score=0.97 gnl/Spiro4/6074_TR3115_c0_g1_i1:88-990(+)